MDIKVFIPVPTFCLQFEKAPSINGKKVHVFSCQENKRKCKMHDFKYESNIIVRENSVKNINIYHLRAHFIVVHSISSAVTLQKWGETKRTTSLLLIRTSSDFWFADTSVFISSGSSLCSNKKWIRNHSVFTTALQYSIVRII